MALPLTRDYDAADSGPLPATTVNNLQDAVVGGLHGALVQHVGAEQAAINSTHLLAATAALSAVIPPAVTFAAAGGATVVVGCPRAVEGLRISEIVVRVTDVNTSQLVVSVHAVDTTFGGASATIGAAQTTPGGGAANVTLTFNAGTDATLPYVVAAGFTVEVLIRENGAGAGGNTFKSVEWTIDHP